MLRQARRSPGASTTITVLMGTVFTFFFAFFGPAVPAQDDGGSDADTEIPFPPPVDRTTSELNPELDQDPHEHDGCCDCVVPEEEPDPVDLASGAMKLSERDLGLRGIADLDVVIDRYHSTGTHYDGPLGARWDSPIFRRIQDSGPGTQAHFFNGQMREDIFTVAQVSGGVTTYWTPTGHFFQLTRTDVGGVVRFTLEDALGYVEEYEFNKTLFGQDWYRLAVGRDTNGNQLTYAHDVAGRLSRITDTMGRPTTVEYYTDPGRNGLVRKITDAAGASVEYGYDGSGHMTSVKAPATADHPNGSTTSFGYDAAGRLSSITEPGAAAPYLVNVFDASGRVVQQQLGAASQVTTVDYSSYPTVTVTGRAGDVTDYVVNSATHRILSKSVHEGTQILVTTYQYDGQGHMSRITTPTGQVVERVFDFSSGSARSRANLLRLARKAHAADPTPLVDTWTYSSALNRVLSHMSARNNALYGGQYVPSAATRYGYDTAGNLVQVTFPDVTTPTGTRSISVTFEHDALGRVTKQIEPNGTEVVYEYDTATLRPYAKRETVDPTGDPVVTDYEYDPANRVTRMTSGCGCSGGRDTSYVWNARGELESLQVEVDAMRSRLTEFHHDGAGRLVLRRDQDDSAVGDGWATTTWTHDLLGNPTSLTQDIDASTQVTTSYVYDLKGRLKRILEAEGNVVEYTYDSRNNLVETRSVGDPIDPLDDLVSTRSYDASGRLVGALDARGGAWQLQWDGYDRLSTEVDRLGNSTAFVWDEDGNPLSFTTTAPSGPVIDHRAYTYDELDRLVRMDRANADENGVPIGDGAMTVLREFDDNGRVSKIVLENGASFTYAYDAHDRLVSARDSMTPPNGADFEYNPDGTLLRQWYVEGNTLTGLSETRLAGEAVLHDWEGRPLEIRDASGASRLYEWDLAGRLEAVTDLRGFRRELGYDELGRLLSDTRRVDPGGAPSPADLTTTHAWDLLSRKSRTTVLNGPHGADQSTDFFYDMHGPLRGIVYADGTSEHYEYDANLDVSRLLDPNGSQVDYTRDAAGQVTDLAIQRAPGVAGMTFIHFVRDALGRVVSAANDDYTVTRAYTSLGDLASEQVQEQGGPFASTIEMDYDSLGKLARIYYPAHTSAEPDWIEYQRDGIGRITGVHKQEGTSARNLIDYWYVGRRKSFAIGPNRGTSVTYDARGWAVSVQHFTATRALAQYFMIRDPLGNVEDAFRTHYDGGGTALPPGPLDGGLHREFDGADRLTMGYSGLSLADLVGGNHAAAQMSFQYDQDRAWNRTRSVTTLAGTPIIDEPYTGNVVNEYDQIGPNPQSHDPNGNTVQSNTGAQLTFDYRNRLVGLQENGDTVSVRYGPFGRRLSTQRSYLNQTEELTYAGWDPIEARISAAGFDQVREFHYGDGLDDVLEMRDVTNGGHYQYFRNPEGSLSAVTDDGGGTVESFRYLDFGRRLRVDPQTGGFLPDVGNVFSHPVGFQGRWTLAGLEDYLDFRHRLYLPAQGRFAQPDPLGFPDGRMNRYHFAHGNPNSRDPLGLAEPGKKSDPAGGYTHVGETKSAGEGLLTPEDTQAAADANWDQDHGPNVAGFWSHNNYKYHAFGSSKLRIAWGRWHLSRFEDDCSIVILGQALHFFQDLVYHRDMNGEPYNWIEGHGVESFCSWGGFDDDPDNLTWPATRLFRHMESIDISKQTIRRWLKACGKGGTKGHPEKYKDGKPKPTGPITPGPGGPSTPGPSGPFTPGPLGPTTPGPSGPSTPGPSGPTTPGPSGPTTPGPSGPSTPGPAGGSGNGSPTGPRSPSTGGPSGPAGGGPAGPTTPGPSGPSTGGPSRGPGDRVPLPAPRRGPITPRGGNGGKATGPPEDDNS